MIDSTPKAKIPLDPKERSSRILFWCVMAAFAFFCTFGIVAAVTGFPMNTVTAEETDDGITETIKVGEDGQVTTEDGSTVIVDSAEGPAASADEGTPDNETADAGAEADAETDANAETTAKDGNQG